MEGREFSCSYLKNFITFDAFGSSKFLLMGMWKSINACKYVLAKFYTVLAKFYTKF